MPIRPASRPAIATENPLPTSPRRASAPTCTPSRVTALVSEASSPSLRSGLPMVTPATSNGTMTAVMPACLAGGSATRRPPELLTRRSASSSGAYRAFVTNSLVPSSTQPSPSRRAVPRSDAASLPLVGSVRPNAPRPPPSMRHGSQRALIQRAETDERSRDDPAVHRHTDRERGPDGGKLLEDERERDRGRAEAAVPLRHRHA